MHFTKHRAPNHSGLAEIRPTFKESIKGPKMKTVFYPHRVFSLLLPYCCTHIRLEYGLHTGTLQPPTQESCAGLHVLCLLCESRIRTAAFLTCNKTHTFPSTYATIQWISLKEKMHVNSTWLILFSFGLLCLERSNNASVSR